jgi:hypothetical protein
MLERSSGETIKAFTEEAPSPQTADNSNKQGESALIEHSQFAATVGRRDDGKTELRDADAPEVLGFALPRWRKWSILGVIFVVQCSMNFNASIYANGVEFLTDKFEISEAKARVGQMIFLVSYAFGCELWAPWSEELGRWPTLQLSLLFVNSECSCLNSLTGSLADPGRLSAQLYNRRCCSFPRGYLFRRRIRDAWDG